MRELSHSRCLQRCCCPSWTCTPHVAGCPALDDWARSERRVDGRVASVLTLVGHRSGGELGVEAAAARRPRRGSR